VEMPVRKRQPKRKKQKKPIRFIVFLLLLLFLIILGVLVGTGFKFGNVNFDIFNRNADAQETNTTTVSPSNTTSPKPSVVPTASPADDITLQGVKELKKSISTYIDKQTGEFSVYYLNLSDGSQFGINDTEVFVAASTIKIPINFYLFKEIEAGDVSKTDKVTYLSRDYEGGTGDLQYEKKGTIYTVDELSKLSIELSDNVATNMLQRFLGGRSVIRGYMKKLGGIVTYGDKNITCAKDMALYMKRVYEFSVSNPKLGGHLIDYFENTIFNDRIPKLLPKDIKVAHKIGNFWSEEWGAALHDIGIVYADKPYIISVMTKKADEDETYDAIANISKMVYEYVVNS
jgi:beta-lactamase class A